MSEKPIQGLVRVNPKVEKALIQIESMKDLNKVLKSLSEFAGISLNQIYQQGKWRPIKKDVEIWLSSFHMTPSINKGSPVLKLFRLEFPPGSLAAINVSSEYVVFIEHVGKSWESGGQVDAHLRILKAKKY